MLHALSLAVAHITGLEQRQGYLDARVGGRRTIQALRTWVTGGTLGLQSAMASEIAMKLREIVQKLPGALIISTIPHRFLEGAHILGSRPLDVIFGTARRLYAAALPLGVSKWAFSLFMHLRKFKFCKEEVLGHIMHKTTTILNFFSPRAESAGLADGALTVERGKTF